MRNKTICATALLLAIVAIGFGQVKNSGSKNKKLTTAKKSSRSQKQMPTDSLQSVSETAFAIPSDKNAWTVEIRTSGGLTGRGVGNFFVASNGSLSFDGLNLNGKTSDLRNLETLASYIKTANFPRLADSPGNAQTNQADSSLNVGKSAKKSTMTCNDCIETSITIRRRAADNSIQTFSASWNENTMNEVAKDFVAVYERALALRTGQQPEVR